MSEKHSKSKHELPNTINHNDANDNYLNNGGGGGVEQRCLSPNMTNNNNGNDTETCDSGSAMQPNTTVGSDAVANSKLTYSQIAQRASSKASDTGNKSTATATTPLDSLTGGVVVAASITSTAAVSAAAANNIRARSIVVCQVFLLFVFLLNN